MAEMQPPVAFERWLVKWAVLPLLVCVLLGAVFFDVGGWLDCRHRCRTQGHSDYRFVIGGRAAPNRCECLPVEPAATPTPR